MLHLYVSTACQHGQHERCYGGTCSFCGAECLCPCHRPTQERKLDQILQGLGQLNRQERRIMVTVGDLQKQTDEVMAAITEESNRDDAIIALVEGNSAVLATLQAKLDEAIRNGADPAQLQGLSDSLTTAKASALANAQKVLEAVNKNTPPPPTTGQVGQPGPEPQVR